MTKTTRRDLFSRIAVAALVFAGVLLLVDFGAAEIVGGLIVLGGAGATWLFVSGASQQSAEDRVAWLLVGAGITLWLAAQLFLGLAYMFGSDVRTGTDVISLVGYLVLFAGVLAFPSAREHRMERVRVALDAAIGALAFAGLTVLLVPDLFSLATDRAGWVWPTFALADLALLGVALAFLRRHRHAHVDTRMAWLVLALVFTASADLYALITMAPSSPDSLGRHYALWVTALLCVLGAAVEMGKPIRRDISSMLSIQIAGWLLPYFGVATFAAATSWRLLKGDSVSNLSVGALGLVGGLILLRLYVSSLDTRRSVERQRDAVVASVSHELRTPLTAITGFSRLLIDQYEEFDDDERRTMLGTIAEQAEHLGRIVEDLLQVARARSAPSAQPVPIELSSAIRRSAVTAGIDGRVTIEGEEGIELWADPVRLEQVLVNLFTNADRYGNGRVEVLTSGGDGFATVEVHDDGPGIPTRHSARVWERFERGEHRLSSVPGSGVGLWVTRAIVDSHGGSIDHRPSARLGGTVFVVRWPIAV